MTKNSGSALIDGPEIAAVTELADLVEGFTTAVSKKETLSTADEAALEKIDEALAATRSVCDLAHISSDSMAALYRNVRRVAQLAASTIEVKTSAGIVSAPGLSDGTVRREIVKLGNQIAKLKPAIVGEIHAHDKFRAELETTALKAIESAYHDRDLGAVMQAIEVQVTSEPEDGRFAPWRVDPLRALCDAARMIVDSKRREHPQLEALITAPHVLAENLGKFLAQRDRKK